ncbi:UDP-N-acetylmuramoyl-L-alanyl-D-glutamate--2,6-diaminopimelate ligase [Paroceanicella profunda]|uniref:UDP-N-acetylmuramoyl-L-alanyl-D-glutamate--2,6-diaminopimelate ligase n=1 Tax=Paroceanicella profunda TaxID=2579971 RepID=A0A5B8FTV7_9RHOB|nr:UDP-N-acetylmuramoyl-L-alanyl-D-glutamate--2,6-diaminopimelate ligase [Paroceanicella profunda]QDL90510.1 UDP-N-acetylmuramoyl-L-alanyl-D-glutamate--2,6-diaminopimelate ligase [Paroceanicella profunda]
MEEPRSATLKELALTEGSRISGEAGTRVTGLSVDSRQVRPGHLFAALPGARVHGAEFIPYALRMEAGAVLTDGAGAAMAGRLNVPVIIHPDPRLALARASAAWFGAQPKVMTAVTGTNGKTSVASFTRQIWQHMGLRAVNFGTAGVEGAVQAPLSHTTPEPVTLHRLIARLAGEGVTHAAMEASSHGLEQRRLDGVRLTAAAFTNLTRDHLDYHPSVEAYTAAKLGLFDRVLPVGATAVLNLDDAAASLFRLVAIGRGQRVIGVGCAEAAELRLIGTAFESHGQVIRFGWQGREHVARLALVGGFQAANALVAAALAIGCGAEAEAVFAALPALTGVRGRMELAGTRANGAAIYVDFAHTPDALATALAALRPHCTGRLVCVFGAGGDRDPGKRPLMGAAVAAGADLAIVTDDNPRSEDPATIRAAILAAAPGATEIGDRAEAILTGVDALGPDDLLLIAGKGHEAGQIVGGEVYPFDDGEQARAAILALDGHGVSEAPA